MPIAEPGELEARREIVEASDDLRSLRERLDAFARRMPPTLYFPEEKALLSQDGGVCAEDGSRLIFDPFSPDAHRCPQCGRVHEGSRHHRTWVWRYHLWLSERAVHFALLAALGGDEAHARRAHDIIAGYAERYASYPNVDNVLGPTRLFFSTYHESIWLLQLIAAAALLPEMDEAVDEAFAGVVDESAHLIATFEEGASNRQVWNDAAMIAAAQWLDDDELFERGASGPLGIVSLLDHAVTAQGRWWEGENYHLFALRGFLLAAELLRVAGRDVYADPMFGPKLAAMYSAPLAAVPPDLTVPARGDSPYGVTLLQPRFCELWEIGWARCGDERLASVLQAIYAADAPDAADPGFEEIAEVETNRPPARMRRTDLGWKALLWMRPDRPAAAADMWVPAAGPIASGPVVLRPAADRYVALETGGTAAGHGHADVLHLNVAWPGSVLTDFGTGSYVSPTLHWYRSGLAHNAPGVHGEGQRNARAWCGAFDERDGWSWCRAEADGLLGPDTHASRSVVAGPNYVLDVVDVSAPDVTVDLPILPVSPLDATALGPGADVQWAPSPGAGHETGYDRVERVHALAAVPSRFEAGENEYVLAPRADETVYVAWAPGPPSVSLAPGALQPFLVRQAEGSGRWVQLYAARATVRELTTADGVISVELADGGTDRVRVDGDAAWIDVNDGTSVHLRGVFPVPSWQEPSSRHIGDAPAVSCPTLPGPPDGAALDALMSGPHALELEEGHYRRSEEPYPGPDVFSARVACAVHETRLHVIARVTKPELVLRDAGAPNPQLDNETPDIHSDGVQLFVERDGWCGYLIVPEEGGGTCRVRPVAGTAAADGDVTSSWRRTADGYEVTAAVDLRHTLRRGSTFRMTVVVNEMHAGRMRRAGQLALGGTGEWVYLRGDRESPGDALEVEVV